MESADTCRTRGIRRTCIRKKYLSEPLHPFVRRFLILLTCILCISFVSAGTVMEEQSTLDLADVPLVRYWKPALPDDTLGVQTVSNLNAGVTVPSRKDPKLLVLLYHNIVFGRTGNVYNRDLYNFEHDLAYLKRNFLITDFSTLPVQQDHAMKDRAIITFDDGDLSIYAIVYPLFKKYGIEATFFLVPEFIGHVGYMSWDQVREMNSYRTEGGKQLFHFGSHSLTHRRLGELSETEVIRELSESKKILETELGTKVTVLALPFGSGAGDPQVIKAAKSAGYTAIRTSTPEAVKIFDIDMWDIGAMNVENYSTDRMVQHALKLLGR